MGVPRHLRLLFQRPRDTPTLLFFHGQECTGGTVNAYTLVHGCVHFVGIFVYQLTFKNADDYFIIFHYLHCTLDVALIRTSLPFRVAKP